MTTNNHYAGFGPGTVNIFRNMLGLPETRWEENEEDDEQQKHLEQYPQAILNNVHFLISWVDLEKSWHPLCYTRVLLRDNAETTLIG